MNLDSRVERNIRSVAALYKLLQCALANPGEYLAYDSLLPALRSQGSLAGFGDDTRGISPASLNTVKRIAGTSLEGGFDALDRLRIAVKEALVAERDRGVRSNKTDKAGLARRVKELERENQDLRQDLFLLTLAIEKSLNQSKYYAAESTDAKVLARCKREQRVLLDMLSLRKQPIATNVVNLRHD